MSPPEAPLGLANTPGPVIMQQLSLNSDTLLPGSICALCCQAKAALPATAKVEALPPSVQIVWLVLVLMRYTAQVLRIETSIWLFGSSWIELMWYASHGFAAAAGGGAGCSASDSGMLFSASQVWRSLPVLTLYSCTPES